MIQGVAILWYWVATDTPSAHRRVNAAELDLITAESETVAENLVSRPRNTPWLRLFSRPDLWCLAGAYAAVGYVAYFYFAWFYLYLVNERGFSVEHAGFYTVAPFLTSAIASPVGGWLSDFLCRRYGKRVGRGGLASAGMIVTGVFIFLGAGTPDPYLCVAFMSVSIGTLFLTVAAFWATTIDLACEYAGTVSGFMNMGGNLGGAISPTLTPYLAQRYDWEVALTVLGTMSLVGALYWLGVHPDRAINTHLMPRAGSVA